MKLGTLERKMLAGLQDANAPLMVTAGEQRSNEQKSRVRAAQRLKKKGLVAVERGWSKDRIPRQSVLWMRLTPMGQQFAEIYYTPLRTGGRIQRSKFETETGATLPVRGQWRNPIWLTTSLRRARSLPPASTASQTAAQ